ncbi:MAG: histidine phosphatase family protein [Gammaproteobacteria bacterium]
MQVYFMRHGQTNFNILKLCNDKPSPDVHLTETGKQQAQVLAEKFKSIDIQRIITSELPRTRETANIVNQYHHAPIDSHPGINDIRSGFDGQPVVDYQQAIAADPLHLSINHGESLLDHKTRVIAFLHWLQQQSESSILVVAHEETLRVIAAYTQQLDDDTMIHLAFDNCEFLTINMY